MMDQPKAMGRDELLEYLRTTMATMFGTDPATVTAGAHLVKDLDLDSIDAVDLLVRLQTLTGQRVAEDQLKKLRTVGDVLDLVEAQLRQIEPIKSMAPMQGSGR